MHFVPSLLCLNHQCLTVLDCNFRARSPEEGCALLLGPIPTQSHWLVNTVWPCCNVWQPPEERTSCFAIDPREQLAAQRWARGKGLQPLAVAHSHPGTAAFPSEQDRQLGLPEALMLITDRDGVPRAWWLDADRRVTSIPTEVWDSATEVWDSGRSQGACS